MSFLFKSKAKSPQDLVKQLKEGFSKMDQLLQAEGEEKKSLEKVNDDLTKALIGMKGMLTGDSDGEISPDLVAQLSHEVYSQDILALVTLHLPNLQFEARKDVCLIFTTLLKRQIGNRFTTVEYLSKREAILCWLIYGYEHQETALICGMMLRECLKHEALAKALFVDQETPTNQPLLYKLFDYVELPTFDIASDAFASLKEVLTRHKTLVAEFLISDYDRFFEKYNRLLESENYVTRRQSLKLLGELLLDRSNFESMTKYISVPDHLKLMMNLLKDKSRNIQFEAFHVFKIFVANPNKSKAVLDILLKNKEKLVSFLAFFQPDRKDDDQFAEEKNYLIKQIEALQDDPKN